MEANLWESGRERNATILHNPFPKQIDGARCVVVQVERALVLTCGQSMIVGFNQGRLGQRVTVVLWLLRGMPLKYQPQVSLETK